MADTTDPTPELVVGIGASAGGIDACTRFLAAMPVDLGVAIVIVMHLDPTSESRLVEIFRRSTMLPIEQATEPKRLLRDHVYVIAPATSLSIRDGVLYPEAPHEQAGVKKPVDDFFSSLAADQRARAVAILLSGTGSNGSTGLPKIKANGGLCLAQDPATAEYDSMPRHAIETGHVDQVASPSEMPELLVEHLARPGSLARPVEADMAEALDGVLDLLTRTFGVNFRSSYKRGTLLRRADRRMSLRNAKDWNEYLTLLRDDPRELGVLYNELLVGVTRFFRDPEVFDYLATAVFPDLVRKHEGDLPIKIWVPGCATGEEAYSLAILILEELERTHRPTKLQVFASDIAEAALAHARRGVYPATIRDSVSPERLARFFHKEGQDYRIASEVRDSVTFAAHNLLADPPFSKIDVVSCRNVMIYLEAHAQQRLFEIFQFALKPGGVLVLGASEAVGQHRNLFEPISQKARVYRSIATKDTRHGMQWAPDRMTRGLYQEPAPKGPKISRVIEQLVLGRYTHACVAVSEALEIQSFFGPTENYLSPPTGEARMDLLSWAKPGLYPRLRSALEQAKTAKGPVTATDMRVERDGVTHRVACTIESITPLPNEGRLFLVVFRDMPAVPVPEVVQTESEEPLVRQLESELRQSRGELQNVVEQLDSTNEEYRASYEELLSLNEELQSNNEELQASKEELQSLNEEMITINRQLEDKNIELRSVGTDLSNLLVSTMVPIVFLDRDLRVRRYTPAATDVMRLVPSDLGRSVEHVKQRFADEHLLDDSRRVLDKLVPVTAEIETEDRRFYTRTILPYRTDEDRIDGVCVTYHDVTAQRMAALAVDEARRYAEAIVATVQTALVVLTPDLRVLSANDSFYRLFGVARDKTEGARIYELGDRQWDIVGLRTLLESVLPAKCVVHDFEVDHKFEGIGRRTMRLNARRMERDLDTAVILLSFEDITSSRAREQAATDRADTLVQEHERKNEFLAMLGHELRNPLSALMHGLDLWGLGDVPPEPLRSMMTRQAKRIAGLLDQLLDVARLTRGKIEIAQLPVDLEEAATIASEAVAPLFENHRHRFVLVKRGEPALVIGDLGRLTQVIENLLTNAAKYTPDGGLVELTIDSDETSVFVRVRDNGIGMDPELLPHIFELFTQAPRTLDRSLGGLGLGLAVVERVVAMHHGSVKATSPGRGQGSEVIVTLPRLVERRARPGAGTDAPVKAHRILVVDDEPDVGRSLADLLARAGHDCRLADGGAAALEVARTFDPEVIILDLGMPEMDGYETAKRLREEHHARRLILAISGYRSDRDRLARAGFDGHLLKPASLSELQHSIAEWEAVT